MNVEPLLDRDLDWCDCVFISAMVVQQESFAEVVKRCKSKNITIIAGGPYPTAYYKEIHDVDHLVLGEVEEFFADFLLAFEAGKAPSILKPPQTINALPKRPNMLNIPTPRYDLIKLRNYGSVALQFSRGCPYDCEFCDITKLFGHIPRTKTNEQMIAELNILYNCGWRRSVFLVDDNFIGHKKRVTDLLPCIISWQKAHRYPFSFYTEASVDLADTPELMNAMADAGFDMVFLGLETPNTTVLKKVNKHHNIKKGNPDYLKEAVIKIQQHGMEVSAGFILGLDGEDRNCFDSLLTFIKNSGIPTAMVGLLTALKDTKLYERLKAQGRLVDESNGNNVSLFLNYVPEMQSDILISGYKRVMRSLYDDSLHNYFDRCYTLIKNWNRRHHCARRIRITELVAVFKSLRLQLFSRQGPAYLKFLFRVIRSRPSMLAEAIRLAIMGYHYEKFTREQHKADEFKCFLDKIFIRQQELTKSLDQNRYNLTPYLHRRMGRIYKRYNSIDKEFHNTVNNSVVRLQKLIEFQLTECSKKQAIRATSNQNNQN